MTPNYEYFKYTSKTFHNNKLDLMAKKGIYSHDYMDSFDKFDEVLPTKENFFEVLPTKYQISTGLVNKLMPTLSNKEKYSPVRNRRGEAISRGLEKTSE